MKKPRFFRCLAGLPLGSHFGLFLDPPGPLLGRPWASLGHLLAALVALLGALGPLLGRSWDALGRSWGDLGPISALLWSILAAPVRFPGPLPLQ